MELKTDPKILYSYIRSKQLTNNRIITLKSDSGEDMSTPTEIADSLNTYFQSVFVKKLLMKVSLTLLAEPVLTASMMEKQYPHWQLYIEKPIT